LEKDCLFGGLCKSDTVDLQRASVITLQSPGWIGIKLLDARRFDALSLGFDALWMDTVHSGPECIKSELETIYLAVETMHSVRKLFALAQVLCTLSQL